MPQFTWTGRDDRQIVRSGTIEAPSAARATAALAARAVKAEAVLPLPDNVAAAASHTPPDLALIHTKDLLGMTRQLHQLLRQGAAANRAFTALGSTTANPALAEILHHMGQQTQAGQALSQAMDHWPRLFDTLARELVRYGEGEKRLPDALKALHLHLEFDAVMNGLAQAAADQPEVLAAPALQHITQARFLAALVVTQQAGWPLGQALEAASRHSGNAALVDRVQHAVQNLPSGDERAALLARPAASGPSPWPEPVLWHVLAEAELHRPAQRWAPTASAADPASLAQTLTLLTQQRAAAAENSVDLLLRRWRLLRLGAAFTAALLALGLAAAMWG